MDVHITPQARPMKRSSHARDNDTSPSHYYSQRQRSGVTFELPARPLSQEAGLSGDSGVLSHPPDSKTYAARVAKSSQAIGAMPPEKSYPSRDLNPAYNVKRIVEERKRSSEACEQHVRYFFLY